MNNTEPLKITLEDLGEEEKPAETPFTPGEERGKLRDGAAQVGQKVSGAVKDSASRVAHKIADTTAEATSRGAEAVRDKVSETIQAQSKATVDAVEARLREVDWKAEAQKGAEGGLRWLSERLGALAEKLHEEAAAEDKSPDDTPKQ